MSVLKKLIPAVLVAAGLIAGLAYLLRPVAIVAPVTRGLAVNAVPASVGVQAERALPLLSEAGGRLLAEDFNLDPGRRVAPGEVLARLDARALQLEIDRIEGEIAAVRRRVEIGSPMERDLENARDALAAAERQAAAGRLAEAEFTRQRRQVAGLAQRLELERAADEQTIRGSENTLAAKRLQLEAMTIRAPMAGQISEVFVNPGQLIGERTELATLIMSTRTVEARVSEENFAGIEIGQKASVRFLTYGDRTYDAKVAKILPTADPATQRYLVHLEVDIEPGQLAPGITGEASIVIGTRPNALILPRRALVGGAVLVVEDGRVRRRPIRTGFASLNAIEVTDGLKEGDLVVVEELDRFRDGDRVKGSLAPGY